LITPLDAALLGAIGAALNYCNFTADWRPPNSTTAGPCNEPSASKIHFSFKFAKDEFNLNIK
jgi:hypothetical protein